MPTANKANLFLRITKVDMVAKTVTGVMTQEVTDKANEKMDYATSKPLFEKWSEGISKATAGKSLGNVRWMHQPIVAGKIVTMDFDDVAKSITIETQPIDDETLAKIDEGFVTGFSIGGNYVGKRWDDPEEPGVKRYTVDPVEVSYVDNPCLQTCTFVRADGVTEERTLKGWQPDADALSAAAQVLAKASGKDWLEHVDEAREAMVAEHIADMEKGEPATIDATTKPADIEGVVPAGDPAVETPQDEAAAAGADGAQTLGNAPAQEPKAAAAQPEAIDWGIAQVFQVAADGKVFASKAEAKKHVDALKVLDTNGSPLAAALAAAKAAATPAPAEDAEPVVVQVDQDLQDIGTALKYLADLQPDAVLVKGMRDVSRFAELITSLAYLQMSAADEANWEGDGSKVPAQIAAALAQLGAAFRAMAEEELNELLACLRDEEGNPIEIVVADGDATITAASRGVTVAKANEAVVQKVGARNSSADKKKIQAAHDALAALGAVCDAENVDKSAGGPVEKAAAAEARAEKLQKDIDAALPQIAEMGETLKKVVGELDTARAEIKKLSEEPAAMPAITKGRIVGKEHDTGGTGVPGGAMDQAMLVKNLIEEVGIDKVRDMVLEASLKTPMAIGMRGGAGDS